MARLGDVCDVLNGYAFKSNRYTNEGVRIIRISNVQKGYIEDNAPAFYPSEDINTSKYQLFEGDLLLSLTGNVGRVGILEKQFMPAALNQRVACIRIKDSDILYKPFLFNFLNSDFFEEDCIHSSNGVAQKNMSTEWLKDYKIPLPPLDEQRKIAAVLDKVSDLIAKRRQQLDKLDEMVKARFVEMFGTFPANKNAWPVGTIRDVIQEARYGSSRPSVEGGQYPYLRMNNITYSGELDLTDIKQIDVPESELPKCTVQRGDVLFNRTNSKELVGKTCVYDRDEMMVLAGFVIRVRVNDHVLPEFLSAFLNSDFSKQMLLGMCKTAIGQANINAQEMQNIGIYIPPINLQKEFVVFKQQVNKSKTTISHSLDKLETLKKALMQEYFG